MTFIIELIEFFNILLIFLPLKCLTRAQTVTSEMLEMLENIKNTKTKQFLNFKEILV